jgi:N-acetylglucosamine malate deacetylase 1
MAEMILGEATQKLDVLCFGPHPDDSEIGAGGVLLKLAQRGYKCGVVDMTAGEMGSGGDVETRRAESLAAAQVLQLSARECMGLPDCGLEDKFEWRCAVAEVIRRYRPEVVLGPYYDLPPGRGLGHNDHIKGGLLVAHGANFAHLRKLPAASEVWHPRAVYFYFLPPELNPTFVVDITGQFEDYIRAIMCHVSQFGKPEQNLGIRHFFESNAARWGRWAGGRYAQAFYTPWPLAVNEVMSAARIFKPSSDEQLEHPADD